MSKDSFTLFSTAHISRDEYNGWLHQLNAVMIAEEGGPYDARLSRDACHVWISLLEGKWFDIALGELEEVAEKLSQLLGYSPKSAIVLTTNDARGSKILAVQFAALCAERYHCLVYQHAGQAIFSAQELLELRDAGMGFDGFTWEKAGRFRIWDTLIIEEENKHEEVKRQVVRDFKEHFTDLQA